MPAEASPMTFGEFLHEAGRTLLALAVLLALIKILPTIQDVFDRVRATARSRWGVLVGPVAQNMHPRLKFTMSVIWNALVALGLCGGLGYLCILSHNMLIRWGLGIWAVAGGGIVLVGSIHRIYIGPNPPLRFSKRDLKALRAFSDSLGVGEEEE